METKKKLTKAEQGQATINNLLQIAQKAFSERGYRDTSMEEIVRLAGLTRGALYHHFSSKKALFLAVFENAQRMIADNILKAAQQASTPWEELLAGCYAFLETCIDPQIQQIVVIDAPAALGWKVWREYDEKHGMSQLIYSLNELTQHGIIQPLPVEALAHLLSGAMNEGVLWIAQAENQKQALEETYFTLEALLQSIRIQ